MGAAGLGGFAKQSTPGQTHLVAIGWHYWSLILGELLPVTPVRV